MSKEFYFETLKEKYGDFPTDATNKDDLFDFETLKKQYGDFQTTDATNKKVIEQIASQLLIDARYYGTDLQLREKEDIINFLNKVFKTYDDDNIFMVLENFKNDFSNALESKDIREEYFGSQDGRCFLWGMATIDYQTTMDNITEALAEGYSADEELFYQALNSLSGSIENMKFDLNEKDLMGEKISKRKSY